MTSSHRVLGAPRGRVHPAARGSNSRIALVGCWWGRRSRCPYHRTRLCAAMVDAGGWPVRARRSALVTCSVQWMPRMRRRARESKPSRRLLSVAFRGQVSAPYRRTEDIRLLYILILVLSDMLLCRHNGRCRDLRMELAMPRRRSISGLRSPTLDSVEPR